MFLFKFLLMSLEHVAECPLHPRVTQLPTNPPCTKPFSNSGNGLKMANILSSLTPPPVPTHCGHAAMHSATKTKSFGSDGNFWTASNSCTTIVCLNSISTHQTKKLSS